MKKESTPNYAFGIKHSPYVGRLKGDEWVHARTEVVTPPAKTVTTKTVTTNGHAIGSGSSNKAVSQSVTNGGSTTSTTRTHSDGTKIRTETFTYTKGPTIKTTTTTTQQIKVA